MSYYLEYSTVVSAFENLIKKRDKQIDNGIIGILFLMKHSGSSNGVNSIKRTPVNLKKVTDDINHLFSFRDKKSQDTPTQDCFILSENFQNEILKALDDEKIDLLSIAVICLQSEPFNKVLDEDELIAEFKVKFNLPDNFVNACFEKKVGSLIIDFSKNYTDSTKRKELLEKKFERVDKAKKTFTFSGGWAKSAGGSFGSGAYAQKLSITSAVKEAVFVPAGQFQSSLSYSGNTVKIDLNPLDMNVLYFGPSGTGKSTEAKRELVDEKGVNSALNLTQITFHPEYTYADFVGSLKPVTLFKKSENNIVFDSINSKEAKYNDLEPIVEFKFEAGPFVEACLKAANDAENPHALIIDEINRGNVPEIMGDIFQLLDRGNTSHSNSELQKHLKDHSKTGLFDEGLVIPSNLYIYATLNPADQNVYPLDTAFKRRWKRKYLQINSEHDACEGWKLSICGKNVPWGGFLKLINKHITHELKLSEDKQLGQFFIKLSKELADVEVAEETLKVISYLWEDIPRSKKGLIFGPEYGKTIFSFSEIYDLLLSEKEEDIFKLFSKRIAEQLNDIST